MASREYKKIVDVTKLNSVLVWAVATPTTIVEVQDTINRTQGPISIGGGRFSMGGQIASPNSLHIDLRRMNQVLQFSPEKKTIIVQAGIRWCDIQRFIDPHGFAVKVMQTYANFTVGGSLSVNAHGRYMGLGPIVLSVQRISLVLANSDLVHASATENSEIFYAAIGGYGAIGIIVEAELSLAKNTRVEQKVQKFKTMDYMQYFKKSIRNAPGIVFHNADMYPPKFLRLLSISWFETKKPPTVFHRLRKHRRIYAFERYFFWMVSESLFGKLRREFIVDPLFYFKKRIHWRNFEAGMDVAELEPLSRSRKTYVLQEYFIPINKFNDFVPLMRNILNQHKVNVINISIRHALPDPGVLLAWAREEVFAFVLYYKQGTDAVAKDNVAIWTRELIDAAISLGGCYYLPYQPHATAEQFHTAYPRAKDLFTLKKRLDPDYRLRGSLWDKYYSSSTEKSEASGDFHAVYNNDRTADSFFKFLKNIFHIYPESRLHSLIKEAVLNCNTDEEVYAYIQQRLVHIKPFHADLTYALPALIKQKKEMTRQTVALVGQGRKISGYVEIGTTGRYTRALCSAIDIEGPKYIVSDVAPSNSIVDLIERGQLKQVGTYVPLADYEPLSELIADASVDLVTCYIGLHHAQEVRLKAFVQSIFRVLRPGGLFILRDHDVKNKEMHQFVSLAHTVFNAGLNVTWEINQKELRLFAPINYWVEYLENIGFVNDGLRLIQSDDSTDNTLVSFTKSTSSGK